MERNTLEKQTIANMDQEIRSKAPPGDEIEKGRGLQVQMFRPRYIACHSASKSYLCIT